MHIGQKNTVTVIVPKILQVAPCSVLNVMYILFYTAVRVVDAHVTKYQVVGVTRTVMRVHFKGACFAMPDSPPTTLGWPGLQWVYAQSARTLHNKWEGCTYCLVYCLSLIHI